jgi:hypothetical protein
MQTLNGEKQALWKAWRRNQSEWQTALECRAIGHHWNNIKAIIKARRADHCGAMVRSQRACDPSLA